MALRGLFQAPGLMPQRLPWYAQRQTRDVPLAQSPYPGGGVYLPTALRQWNPITGYAPLAGPLGQGPPGIQPAVPPALPTPQLGAFAPGGVYAPGGAGFRTAAQAPVVSQPMTYLPLAGAQPGAAAAGQAMSQFRRPAAGGRPGGFGGVATAGVGAAPTQRVPDERTAVAGGPQLRDPIDPRIDRNWYHAFQQEHEGQTPEEFYTGLPYDQLRYHRAEAGWALDEALDDLEWSRGFQRMTGKEPTDDDWKAWWMHNYGRDMRTDEEKRRDRIARKGGGGRKLPRFRGKGQEDAQRPPLWVPPVTYWR